VTQAITSSTWAKVLRGRAPAEVAIAARRELALRSIRAYVRMAWPVVEPTRALLPSVALDGMCAAAQAVAEGRIRRLAVSTCPGTSKSIFWAVLFPSWMMARQHGQSRIMVGSYSWSFATRDSQRCRDLVQSDWYRWLIDDQWGIRDDADRKDDWWTTATGRRLITSVEGKSTGERCTLQIIDDALSAADTHSASVKTEAIRWVNEVLPSRLEDQRVDQRIIVGQRLATDDPIGDVVRRGWKYLVLPAVLEDGGEPCELTDDAGELVWRDPRTAGQPIVELLSGESLSRLRIDLGPSAYAAQYKQSPQDTSAGVFDRAWFARRWVPVGSVVPAGFVTLPELERQVITVDASFKSGESSDFAVVQRWGCRGPDRFLLEQWRKQAGYVDTRDAISEMAKRNPFAMVLIEEAANGHAIIDQLKRDIAGIVAIKPRDSGSGDSGKQARAMSVQGITASGAVVLPAYASWVDAWIDEVAGFPNAKHDDQVDAMVYALRDLQQAATETHHGGYLGVVR